MEYPFIFCSDTVAIEHKQEFICALLNVTNINDHEWPWRSL